MKESMYFVLFAVISAATLVSGIRIKFNLGTSIGKTFFYSAPHTRDAAIAMGWTKLERPCSPLPQLEMYGEPPYLACCLFDPDTGFVAGVQASVSLNSIIGAPFNWTQQGFIPWNPPITENNAPVTYMTKQVYFVSEETLSKSTEERMKAAKADKVLQEDNVWVTSFYQKQKAVSTDTTGIVANGFTKQNCIPWMGTHYFYNMTATTECLDDTLFNWTLLTDSEKLIGVALVLYGKVPRKSGEKDYYERPPKLVIQALVRTGPDCLFDLAGGTSLTTMHIYFIDKPWKIGCTFV